MTALIIPSHICGTNGGCSLEFELWGGLTKTLHVQSMLPNNGEIVATASILVPKSLDPSMDPGDETDPCNDCGKAGEPISLTTGNTSITQTDIHLPGLGGGLTLSRSWNSKFPYVTQSRSNIGMFGPNWRSTYEESVAVNLEFNNIKYSRSDGSFWTFTLDPSGSFFQLVSPANVGATLTSGSRYWTVTYKNGEKRLFANTSGSLLAIIDRNSNVTEVGHDALNRITSVSDAGHRHLYFSYDSADSGSAGNGQLVTKITSDIGITLSYSYDANQGYLLSVTKPDGTNIYFEYEEHGFISAVKDTNGKILESHTYDQYGRGLTSSRANGVEAINMTYPPN